MSQLTVFLKFSAYVGINPPLLFFLFADEERILETRWKTIVLNTKAIIRRKLVVRVIALGTCFSLISRFGTRSGS